MKDQKSFKENYSLLFERVCFFLGNKWRVDNLEVNYFNRIKLTHPDLRHYAIYVTMEKGRFYIVGSADYHYYRYGKSDVCTISPMRDPRRIAGDIKRKILCHADDHIAVVMDYHQKEKKKNEEKMIVLGMLKQLATVNEYNGNTYLSIKNGIKGKIEEKFNGYSLEIEGLTLEKMIKAVGFLTTL
ncbi:hypothetical protein AAH678_31045 [Sodalis endosymbiont of Spalangia cameroni]|uniref:hypothetical protein n=1 Tax=Sodalis praecaptivus TaxID=1239307 RepID=UPI0031F84F88